MGLSPFPGRRGAIALGRYAIRRKLGSGSMGTVYLAEDQRTRKLVALKVIRGDRLSPGGVKRLQEEFQAIASLHHPQIAAAFDFGYTPGGALPFYTREYIKGTPLSPGPPEGALPGEFLRPILDLLDALGYLHAHGILHLDIHPGNLIVAADRDRGSVLIDFGLLRSLKGPELSTAPGDLAGLPPEMLRTGEASPGTDLFLAGRLPLYRLTGEAGVESRLPREIPGWGARRTLDLERIAAKALRADPGQRFQSAEEFQEALARVIGEPRMRMKPLEPGEVTVGRGVELQRIEDLLRRTLAGESALLRISGASGLGKSHLLTESRRRAQVKGLEVVETRFFPALGAAPPLLRSLEAVSAGRRRKVRWLEPLAAEHGGTPEERARRAARSFFDEDGKALVLLLDDLDHADPASRTLAEALLDEALERRRRGEVGRGMGIVATSTRPPPRSADRSDVLPLRPMRAADSRELLQALIRPLSVTESLARKAISASGRSPLRIRQIARALSAEWGRAGVVPGNADLPAFPPSPIPGGLGSRAGIDPIDHRILRALAVLDRPAGVEEIAAAVGEDTPGIARRLRHLEREEILTAGRKLRVRLHQLSRPGIAEELLREVPPAEVRKIHQRLAELLEREERPDPASRENLARHLLRAGRKTEGLRLARETSSALRREGLLDCAVGLLEEALAAETEPRARFALAEEASSILEETGNHRKGVLLLEPFHRRHLRRLPAREGIRLRRRLGVHYHRSGLAEEARRVFEEAQRLADPRRDLEDLVFIDSELAELYNLRGRHQRAEEACRRGLERLASLRSRNDFRARMEVELRASRGHLELRRMNLPLARSELREALRLSRRFRMPAIRAVLLNNLGIVENQLNHFRAAERCFRAAERLLLAAGERRPVVAIACNLALIAAKRGDRDEAQAQVGRAGQLLRRYPGKRIEFFAESTRGAVAGLLGEASEAMETLPHAISLGREVGDLHLARLGELHLAEACLAAGRYGRALKLLQALALEALREGPMVLTRMVHSRLLLLAGLLGSRRLGLRSREVLSRTHRSEVELLEAWNDLWVSFARLLAGEPAPETLEAARGLFVRLGAVSGERFASLGLLLLALRSGERASLESRLKEMESGPAVTHRFLAVAAPLVRAEAHLQVGDAGRARECLSEASGAIVGSPFLELDWRIELLRARLALKEGETTAARGHLHQSQHTRDLLLELLPARSRASFLDHPRFAVLHELSERLERSPRLFSTTRRLGSSGSFEGMVGRSAGMLKVFQAIDRLRDQEVPVLVRGETGTGKELVALAVHRTSLRRKGPFCAVHCGSLPLELFESELFGYEAGAFTGAEETRPGLLESLQGGTLLLDGVSDLEPGAQGKLLRVLDSGVVRRLGSTEERPLDVRFLGSTAFDLKARVEARLFRADLFYRLGGMEIVVPPLRERRADIPHLSRHFLEKHARRLGRPAPPLAEDALKLLHAQEWPGNVRELEAVLLRAMVSLSSPGSLSAGDLEPFLFSRDREASGEKRPLFNEDLLEGRPLEELKLELERAYLTRLYRRVGGDLKRMMEVLGVKQSNLYTWLKRVGLDIRALRKT